MIEQAKRVGAWAGARLVEPSTWKGIGWLLVAAGVAPVGAVEAIAAVGVAVIGLTEVIRKEVVRGVK